MSDTMTRHDMGESDSPYHASTLEDDAHTILINKVSWGAIFAGVVVGLVTQVLLTLLGIGIGAAVLDPAGGDNPDAATFSITSGIWYAVSGVIAAFIGGYVAARMSGKTEATTGALHGLTAWAFATLLALFMLTSSVGVIVGGALNALSGALGGVSQTVAEASGPMLAEINPIEEIERRVAATGDDPEARTASAVNAIRALVMTEEADAGQARSEAAQALANARGIPFPEAEAQVAQIEQEYRAMVASAEQTAVATADDTAEIVSTGALFGFLAMVLGAVAGWLGGRSGVVHPIFADSVLPARRSAADVRS